MDASLNKLQTECTDSKELRSHVELLIKVFKNIHLNPDEEKYQTIKVEKFTSKPKGFQEFLSGNGFEIVDGAYTFVNATSSVKPVLEKLSKYRCDLTPKESEWVAETKVECINVDSIDAKEKRLREEAAKIREKELAAYAENKKYEKVVAAAVKAEAKEDKRRRDLLAGKGKEGECGHNSRETEIPTKSADSVAAGSSSLN